MRSEFNTREALPGDVIHCGDYRLVVIENTEGGVDCSYFKGGIGPYHIMLPHATTYRRFYEDERIGSRASWWDWHPDMTGKTGEV